MTNRHILKQISLSIYSFLFKVCLMLGVEVRPGRMFRNIQERETHWLGNIKQNYIRKCQEQIFILVQGTGMGWINLLDANAEYPAVYWISSQITGSYKNFNILIIRLFDIKVLFPFCNFLKRYKMCSIVYSHIVFIQALTKSNHIVKV